MVPGVGAWGGRHTPPTQHTPLRLGKAVENPKKIQGNLGNNRPETHVINGNLAITDNEC
jgi:hypothetical protein